MKRIEYKYLIDETKAKSITRAIRPFTKYDPFSLLKPDNSYPVYSLYFDSRQRQFFYDKRDGLISRLKIRLRTYSDDTKNPQSIFLEFKKKFGEVSIKERVKISSFQYQRLISANPCQIPGRTDAVSTTFNVLSDAFGLVPTLKIVFDREALFDRTDKNIRVNFDRNITAHTAQDLFSESYGLKILRHHLVMEIKFANTIPNWLHRIITGFQLQRDSFSKYYNSMVSCGIVDELDFLTYS